MFYYDDFLECYRVNPCVIAFLLTCFVWGMAWVLYSSNILF